MSPDAHGMSVGFLIVPGVLGLWHGNGHTDMNWETDAPQHESSCFDWSLDWETNAPQQ